MYTKGEPTGAAGEFLDFVLSQEGQDIVVGPYSALRQLKDDILIKPEEKKKEGDVEGFLTIAEELILRLDELNLFFR